MVFDLHVKVLLGCFLFFPLIPHSAYNVIRLRIGDLLFFDRSSTTILKVFKAVIEKPYWKHLENTYFFEMLLMVQNPSTSWSQPDHFISPRAYRGFSTDHPSTKHQGPIDQHQDTTGWSRGLFPHINLQLQKANFLSAWRVSTCICAATMAVHFVAIKQKKRGTWGHLKYLRGIQ